MTDRLLEVTHDLEKVCPQLEVPVQAGHDDVLATMRRGYTRDEYLRLIERIHRLVPGAAIHTDIIVGFCGETEAHFDATCRLVEQVQFDKVHLAKYSVRPTTVAARRFTDDVPEEEKERRWQALNALQMEVLTAKAARYQGQTVEVLVESHEKGRWMGRTPHNKIVYFTDDRDALQGEEVAVQIDWTGPFSLIGHSLAATPAAQAG
jgi:tRNA-2-methylthio-N6-dimethylallyladenosine synthase